MMARILAPGGEGQPALRDRNATATYGELRAHVLALRDSLRNNGIGAGDRIALCLPKTVATVELMLAVLAAEAAYVPLNPRLRGAPLRRVLEDLRPSLLIADSGAAAAFREHNTVSSLRIAVAGAGGEAHT